MVVEKVGIMSKKKSTKKRKKQTKLSRILASSNNHTVIQKKYFTFLTSPEIKNNVKNVITHRFFKTATNLTKSEKYDYTYSNLTPRSSLENNINWCIGLLIYFKEDIQFFLDNENKLTVLILDGEFQKAHEILDSIDKNCGISTWSMSLRSSIWAIEKENDQLTNYLKDIESKSPHNGFFHAVANNICNRHQDSSLFITSTHSLKEQLNRYLTGETLHFLMFKLIPHDFSYRYNFTHILNREKNSSIIDIFSCLIDFVCYSISRDNEECYENAKLIIFEFNKIFTYAPIQGFANYFEIETDWRFSVENFELLDQYTSGHYHKIHTKGKDTDGGYYDKFAPFEIFSKSCARHDGELPGGIKETILKDLINLFLKDSSYNDSVSNLLSLCHCFQSLTWFKELYFLVIKETQFLESDTYRNISTISSCYSSMNSPLKVDIMKGSIADNYMSKMEASIPESVSINFYKLIRQSTYDADHFSCIEKVENNRLQKYKSIGLINKKKYDEAILILKTLLESTDVITRHEASKLLSEAYIKKGDFESAIDLFVYKSIENGNLILCFDTHKICSVVKSMINTSPSITIPIALSLHSRYVDSDYAAILKYAFEIFLHNNSVSNPIELFNIAEKFDVKLFHYFLEYVCTPEVMKLYLFFTSTSEIEECRIEICKYLVENGTFKDSLIDEIKERTRMLVVRKAVKQVENSRIYADTTSLKISRAKSFKQLFEKYKEISIDDYSKCEDEVQLREIYSVLKAANTLDSLHSVYLPHISLNNKNATFLNLLRRVRDEFTFGDKGLNINLSTRIRHGHLPTTLRKCVTDEHLVTLKLPNSNEFKPNVYWLNKLVYLDDRSLEKVKKSFAKFSANYEELIKEINDSWIQIWCIDQNLSRIAKDNSTKKALFNFSVSPLEAYALQQKLSLDSEYDDFLKIVISWLWERTEINLGTVKHKLSTEARQKVYSILDDFQKEILGIVENQRLVSDLFNALGRSRSALSSNLEQIISWFTRSEGTIVEQFDFDTAIEIAMRSANVHIKFTQEPQLIFEGSSLSFFVDILYILFENAISKSNLPKDEVNIRVDLSLDSDDNIVLYIQNSSKCSESITNANQRLQFYRDRYGRDKIAKDDVQGEGGTGFFKIAKILSKDLELQHTNEFKYDDDNSFSVRITITDSHKVLINEDINC